MPGPLRLDAIAALTMNAAEAAGIGVLLLAMEEPPRLLFVNDVVARWVGEPADALLLRPTFECIAPEDRARIADAFAHRSAHPSAPASLEGSIVTLAGARIPVAVGVARGESGGRPVQIVMLTDVRDRHAAAAKLSASERRFRDLLQAAPDGVVISQRLEIKFANRAAETMLGVAGSLVGHSLEEFLPASELERMRARLLALGAGEALNPAIYRATRPDGREVLAEIASITTEHDGEPAVLAIARDVTEREALQANLERTERLAALGRLSAGMAHEINNPLAFVSLSAEALERRLAAMPIAPAAREELAPLLDNISRGTSRVAAIVSDLKAFSRDGDPDRGPADLEQVLASAIRMVEHEITPRATLVRDVQRLPAVVGAARKLEQVFVNLLMNAVQALPEGRPGRVTISASADASSALVTITDDGIGLARAHIGRAFDPFFTTKPVGVGTGLGLSICHGIVTAAGGSITLESDEGLGTTVRVRLPRAQRSSLVPPAAGSRAPAVAWARRPRVLIVEDQVSLARTLARALVERYEVTHAASVSDARAAIATTGATFDAVLCDMLMPDGTGIDVHESALAGAPELAERFVFMTGGAFLPSVVQFLEHVPPNRRIEKPFALPALEEVLDHIVAARVDAAPPSAQR